MIPSMSRPGNPYDNASCESLMKTLKREEINAGEYGDLDRLRENIAAFIDNPPSLLSLPLPLLQSRPAPFGTRVQAAGGV
jgi:transposase InsO family protein